MQNILDAILAGDATADDFADLELPESYRAAFVHKDEVDMFEGLTAKEKDPRKSLHVDDVAAARARPGRGARGRDGQRHQLQHRVDLDLRAGLHLRLPRALRPQSELAKRHDLPYHVVGSDLAGVVLKTGPGVTKWKPGDRVVAHCLSVELEAPDGHNDTMLDPEQRIWGFETNFGGLADIAMVKANQLMPKPEHLTWEEAASPGLVNCTAYRQLGLQERRRHEAGRQRPDLGRLRRPRRLRDAVRPQRRRHPGLRGLQRGEGRDRPLAWAPS